MDTFSVQKASIHCTQTPQLQHLFEHTILCVFEYHSRLSSYQYTTRKYFKISIPLHILLHKLIISVLHLSWYNRLSIKVHKISMYKERKFYLFNVKFANTCPQSLKNHLAGHSSPQSRSFSGFALLQAASRRCLPVPPMHRTPRICLPPQVEEHGDQSPVKRLLRFNYS